MIHVPECSGDSQEGTNISGEKEYLLLKVPAGRGYVICPPTKFIAR